MPLQQDPTVELMRMAIYNKKNRKIKVSSTSIKTYVLRGSMSEYMKVFTTSIRILELFHHILHDSSLKVNTITTNLSIITTKV